MADDNAYSVLIVDDSVVIQQYFYKLFADNNFVVTGLAETGKDGIDKYKMLDPDLVIMDESMPGMSGLHAMQKIIEYDYDAEVVMLTGFSRVDHNMAYARGASAFFDKPVQDKIYFIKICKELAARKATARKRKNEKD